jgi:16S rRNA (guanine966-N2)-methyltransferase
MRVVAGEFGGRRLVSPEGTATRPTTDRVREAIFNSLASAGALPGAHVADLYAGSGAVGIEALSRGAEHCVFVERDRAAVVALDANLDALDLRARAKVVTGDALTSARALAVDVVFADPPYYFDRWAELFAAVRSELVIAESGVALTVPAGWSKWREKRYGRTWVTFIERDRAGLGSAHR